MYAAGRQHPFKRRAAGEVLQEMLHRYRALGRWV
jgi:hypothetical protein